MAKKGLTTSIRFSDEEHARIAARATAARMSFGEYVRRCGLGEPPDTMGLHGAAVHVKHEPVTQAAPVTHGESLNTLGDDPLRGGHNSNRR